MQKMAGLKANNLLFGPVTVFAAGSSSLDEDELLESDVWGCDPVSGGRLTVSPVGWAESAPRSVRKNGGGGDHRAPDRAAASSVPVSIPNWSKIYGGEVNKRGWLDCVCCEDEEETEAPARPMIPPHELLCWSRGASFSVHEGVGRTLKGRDLSRVRNAVWAKTGFED